MPEKKSFLLYMDREKEISMLSNEQGGILLKAIFQYARTGIAVEISDPVVKVVFSILATQIDEDGRKWEEKRQKRSEAGKKGGRPKKQTKANESNAFSEKAIESNEKQTKAKKAVTVTDTVTVLSLSKDNDNIEQACAAPKGAAQPACDDEYDYIEIDETSGEWA